MRAPSNHTQAVDKVECGFLFTACWVDSKHQQNASLVNKLDSAKCPMNENLLVAEQPMNAVLCLHDIARAFERFSLFGISWASTSCLYLILAQRSRHTLPGTMTRLMNPGEDVNA